MTITQADRSPVTSRRHVLRVLGTAGATVLVAGVGAGGYRLVDTGALRPGHGQAYDPWLHWDQTAGPLGAVAAAILVANPHNTQPWLFEVGDTTIDLLVDGGRHIGSVNPFRREQHVGLGCALENLALGCRARGLEPRLTLLPDGPDAARIAHVDLVAAAPQRDARHDAIGARHTNRGPYRSEGLDPAILAGLVDPLGLPDVGVWWIAEPEPMARMGALLVDAAQAVVDDDRQSGDGFAWFRSDDDAVQAHRDGLTLEAQGLGPVVLAAAKLLPASTRSAGDTFWVTQTRTVHTATAAAYGVITAAAPDDRATQLSAGRLLQRIHLTATARGVALQHMNQITERIDAERVAGTVATFEPGSPRCCRPVPGRWSPSASAGPSARPGPVPDAPSPPWPARRGGERRPSRRRSDQELLEQHHAGADVGVGVEQLAVAVPRRALGGPTSRATPGPVRCSSSFPRSAGGRARRATAELERPGQRNPGAVHEVRGGRGVEHGEVGPRSDDDPADVVPAQGAR